MAVSDLPSPRWVKLLDQSPRIGCHACTTAWEGDNDVRIGVTRTYVKSVNVGVFPQARRVFQVTRCNQCEDAPCVSACPTQAMMQRRASAELRLLKPAAGAFALPAASEQRRRRR